MAGFFPPYMLRKYPAWQFIREITVRTERPRHTTSEGMIRLKTDLDFWAYHQNAEEIGGFEVPYPPFGFNSGMGQRNVSVDELAQKGESPWNKPTGKDSLTVEKPALPASPFEMLNANAKFSVRKIEPDLLARNLPKINEQAEEQGIEPLHYDALGGFLTIGESNKPNPHKKDDHAKNSPKWEEQQNRKEAQRTSDHDRFQKERFAWTEKKRQQAKDYSEQLKIDTREITDVEKWMMTFKEFETGAHFSAGQLKRVFIGSADDIMTPEKLKAGDVFTHTHPKGKPFSDSDIRKALENPNVRICAIGKLPDGKPVIYTVTTSKNWSEKEINELMKFYVQKCFQPKRNPDSISARLKALQNLLDAYEEKIDIRITEI